MRLPSQDPESCASTNSATRPGGLRAHRTGGLRAATRRPLSELDQARVRRREATRVNVELSEVVIEVNVEPLGACVSRSLSGDRHQPLAHSSVALTITGHR